MTILRHTLRVRRRVLAARADCGAATARRRLLQDLGDQFERFARLAPQFAERYRALEAVAPPATAPWTRYAG